MPDRSSAHKPPEDAAVVAARYLTTKQVATVLGVSTITLVRMRLSGKGPPVTRIGRICRYGESALLDWAREQVR